MKKKLRKLPEALQRQVVYRLMAGIVFIFLFFITLVCFWDFYFCIPCFILAVFLILNGAGLFYQGCKGSYLEVRGICRKIETAGIRKRIKSVTLTLGQNTLKILVRQKIGKLAVGDTVIIYLSDKAPVYEQDGSHMICSYYAMEIRNGV